eukprot:scaffold2830_cov131-Cylindrotheca_fusiformis.AAC.48
MQLLCSRATPGPEFLSLSVIFKGDIARESIATGIIEPFLLPSPVSTISQVACIDALKELHRYVNSISKASRSKKGWDSYRMAATLLKEDGKFQSAEMEVYRPLTGSGIGLHYRVIKDPKAMATLVPLIFASSKATAAPNKTVESDISGVIMCIGMSGLPSSIVMSPLHYSLSQRMRDCLHILTKTGATDMNSAKDLMTALLLTEDDDMVTNQMADGMRSSLLDDDKKMRTRRKRTGKLKSKGARSTDHDDDIDAITNSADKARIMVERLQVLSVAETDTQFKKFEGRASNEKSSRKRRKAVADLDGFDYSGERIRAISGRRFSNTDGGSVRSANSKGTLLQSIRDTKRGSITSKSRNKVAPPAPAVGLPALNAPGRDTRLRRSSTDSGSGNVRRRSSRISSGEIAAFSSVGSLGSSTFNDRDAGQRRRGSRDSHSNFDPFLGNPSAAVDGTVSTSPETSMSSNLGEDVLPRFQVSVALNEDLTCFYKLSKMSACSVEGVIQVQVKSNTKSGVPFHLLIRDPLRHIQSIQENNKFAESTDVDADYDADHAFTVSIPKADNYFPVMRYKCTTELRPVPIRVQTRVRLEEGYWRVALQISSNPHNEDSLTDLTVIMGVPSTVHGESLTTSPPGGVWNASKRSVIWCVSELGGGEKFQLQARFVIEQGDPVDEEEKPKFPVLVRCQCMYAQLSEVELDVRDIPEVFPAEVRMKLARRFRLSHRERP